MWSKKLSLLEETSTCSSLMELMMDDELDSCDFGRYIWFVDELAEDEIDGEESIFRISLKLLLSSSGKMWTRSEEERAFFS